MEFDRENEYRKQNRTRSRDKPKRSTGRILLVLVQKQARDKNQDAGAIFKRRCRTFQQTCALHHPSEGDGSHAGENEIVCAGARLEVGMRFLMRDRTSESVSTTIDPVSFDHPTRCRSLDLSASGELHVQPQCFLDEEMLSRTEASKVHEMSEKDRFSERSADQRETYI